VLWEFFERSVYFLSQENVFRVGPESIWNISGDVIAAIIGAMVACVFIRKLDRKSHFKVTRIKNKNFL
jgi:hypothetical protein